MQVDVRHDHSFRVPRPDRTATLAVPNACTSACHRQKTAAWAAAEIERRSGGRAAGYQLFAEAFQAAEAGAPGAADALIRLVRDPRAPAIVRASAIERLEAAGGPLDSTLATDTLRDPSPLVRRAVVAALQAADADARLRLIPPLLSDPIRTVRVQAALALADFDASRLPASFARALDEFLSEQRFNADRPEAQVNLGMMLARRGQPDQAIGAFREAIALDPTFVPAYVNASDMYRSQQNEAAGERILREALARNPAAADAHHALGLSLVRQKRTRDALAELAAAVRLAPRAARYAYVYGVALHDTGSTTDALRVLERSLAAHPFERETLSALATFSEEARQLKDARAYASRLLALDPDNQEVRALVSRLR
jgi:tetratricopeptide (TPR) repeat protein